MMATEEWKREVIKHENIIKELEKKYEKKCKTLKVQLCLDYCKANTEMSQQFSSPNLADYLNIISTICYQKFTNVIFCSS